AGLSADPEGHLTAAGTSEERPSGSAAKHATRKQKAPSSNDNSTSHQSPVTPHHSPLTPTLRIVNARHNNLKNITVEIPLGKFVCVTGASGSGKSSLVNDILVEALRRDLNGGEG